MVKWILDNVDIRNRQFKTQGQGLIGSFVAQISISCIIYPSHMQLIRSSLWRNLKKKIKTWQKPPKTGRGGTNHWIKINTVCTVLVLSPLHIAFLLPCSIDCLECQILTNFHLNGYRYWIPPQMPLLYIGLKYCLIT